MDPGYLLLADSGMTNSKILFYNVIPDEARRNEIWNLQTPQKSLRLPRGFNLKNFHSLPFFVGPVFDLFHQIDKFEPFLT